MSGHSKLSPSSAERWMTCPGSVRACEGLPDSSSPAAAEGTAAHELAERILRGEDGDALVGQQCAENGIVFTDDMLRFVRIYTSAVQALVAPESDDVLMVEQRLGIGTWTGEAGAKGTSDAVLMLGAELVVADLKFGRGVEVFAEGNKQLRIYALAALETYDLMFGPFETVRTIISQPRLGSWSEEVLTVAELLAFGEDVKAAAAATTATDAPLVPSTDACRWCKAAATCTALKTEVLDMFDTVAPEADTPHVLVGHALSQVGMVESWCRAIRAEAERRLLAGQPVQGFKLVQGRMGNRRWVNPQDAEEQLKAMRLKKEQMYDFSLISPTAAEKLTQPDPITGKPPLGARQWKKVIPLIERNEGKPSVAPESDNRPALLLQAPDADFSDVSETPGVDTADSLV